jgi:hypothetical protein
MSSERRNISFTQDPFLEAVPFPAHTLLEMRIAILLNALREADQRLKG